MSYKLTEENFLVVCAKLYDNPSAQTTDEFLEDLNRIKYIKKLLTRYQETGELKERLILNHIIILHNCFGKDVAKILFLKLEPQFYMIKPFLVLLNVLPNTLELVGVHKMINTDDISMDETIVKALRGIRNAQA